MGDILTEMEIGLKCFEDRGRGHWPRNTGGYEKLKKAREQIVPSGSSERIISVIP